MESKSVEAIKDAHRQADKLRQELRTLILQSRPGTPLPSENALAYKYKVSRLTARRILKKMQSEDLVECRNKVGCFVKGKKTVTLLLPCPEFWEEKFYPGNQRYFHYLQGVLQAVTERGLHLETIAVSPTNNRDHIQYSLFNEIHAGSLVICSVWFNRLYELFASRGVHLAILETQHEDYGYQQYHKQFYTVNGNRFGALKQIFDYYYAKGKRRIALFSRLYTKPSRYYPDTQSVWCQNHSLPVLRYSFPEIRDDAPNFPQQLFADLYQKDHFDALIFHQFCIQEAQGTIQETLGLPPELPVFGFEFFPEFSPNLAPFPVCKPPSVRMAREAVAILDEAPPRGTERMFSYDFFNLPGDWEAIQKNNNFQTL